MADDFFRTADRMQSDSRYLHQDRRWHTACYLAGYVVEAGLKAIVEKDQNYQAARGYQHNIKKMLNDLITCARLSNVYRGIPFDSARITSSQLFNNWDPGNRYQPTVWDDEATSQDFQDTAEYIFNFLTELYLNGVF